MGRQTKIELLAPAGDPEKLEIAIHYGADAVYLAGRQFSLRNFSGNFTLEEMKQAVTVAHRHGVKVYVACNVFARNEDLPGIETYLRALAEIGPDAIILADPGVLSGAKTLIPHIPRHLSTQTNTTNHRAAMFWHDQGICRINAARELTLGEIREIADQCPVEIEVFVHGAMCMSYSGRCLLSSFLSKRSSNRGKCSHPCRWKYAVVEELRPGQKMPIREDDRGTYIFNARDLCMIEHLPALIDAGVTSLKIEGRMKGIHYLATVLNVYRTALDAYLDNPATYRVNPDWVEELSRISHRGYCTGFYFGDPDEVNSNWANAKSTPGCRFAGKVIRTVDRGHAVLEVRNKIFAGDIVELVSPGRFKQTAQLKDLRAENGEKLPFAQPGSLVTATVEGDVGVNDLIRRSEESS